MLALIVTAIFLEVLLVTAGIFFRVHPDELSGIAILLLLPFCLAGACMVDVPGPARLKRFLINVFGRRNREPRKQDIP
ncbi:MAG: hypothetical protein LBP38_06900 [Desulfovibrio sp.]|jgi:hypothetical protein|nr:hypothetical protein [Desulfovibrio sp.]